MSRDSTRDRTPVHERIHKQVHKSQVQGGPLHIPEELKELIGYDKELHLPAAGAGDNSELLDAIRKGYTFVSAALLDKMVIKLYSLVAMAGIIT